MTAQNDSQAPDENRLIAERRGKLDALRAAGPAYPNDFRPDSHAATLHQDCGTLDDDALQALNRHAKVAGRMVLKRVMGRASFATLQDTSGRLQLYLDRSVLGDEAYAAFKSWDIGDIIGAEGEVFKTHKGELSLRVQSLRLLAKSLRPLPDKFHGMADQELRYRRRYVDLIVSEETRQTFLARSRIVATIRQFMSDANFLEVETPMLHPIPGGASAKPFITHHNALDMDMYLRIAPELYLKRLIVGGFERVFEINRNFRNEGVSPRHNPEFTMMEFYAAYTDYQWLMDYTESLIRDTALSACGTTDLIYQSKPLDLGRAFDRLTITQAIRKYAPVYTDSQLLDAGYLRTELLRLGAEVDGPALSHAGLGALQLALFEETTETQLWHPTYIIDYPVEVSPLARASDTQADITERFELFACGREIANGFSELNDPEDQAARFRAQVAAKDAGDEEAMYYDADYVRALEYGMPPTGGCGIGIDRLVMMLTDSPNIRDVILFPHMRRED
ncbi:MAG: lysine--tRNA ligase [Castellaniella sp.]|uniref:lysine--tRNA ligase n=1 Tax=Castellaniella sp. TaxID=1955812 RepID=UPI0011FA5E5F|nr:lysine--tRNA ligase [Castellaniella sp.]TAN27821.1 MAG: lysine--tRNA ligase [Castellaniella sp.]